MRIELSTRQPARWNGAGAARPADGTATGALSSPVTRGILGLITRLDKTGTCSLERALERRAIERRASLLKSLVQRALMCAKLDETVTLDELIGDDATVRALALAARSIARYGLSAPQRFLAPLSVVWRLTQACNLYCLNCGRDASARPGPDELSLKEKIGVVDRLSAAGVPYLAISGCEPLTSPHLWPVLKRARERRIQVSLSTNGSLVTQESVSRLMESGVSYVEVHAGRVRPPDHDRRSGQRGGWKRAIDAIRLLVASGMRTGLAACLTRQTIEAADDYVDLAVELGCWAFAHVDFVPGRRGKRGLDDADPTPAQRERLIRALAERVRQGRINIASTAPQFGQLCAAQGLPELASGQGGTSLLWAALGLDKYIGGCGAGRYSCSIQPNGEVTPCAHLPALKAGSMRRQSLSEIWDCAEFRTLRDQARYSDHCGVCVDRSHCGGCRARAYAYYGDLQAGDPGCGRNDYLWDQLSDADSLISIADSKPAADPDDVAAR